MRITKRANIAVRVLMYCAAHPDARITKTEIAEACNASEHHLGQIVNQLAQSGYLRTWRGRYGGIALGRPAEEIRIGALFREFESAMPIAECFSLDTNTCPLVPACRLRPALALAAEAFFQVLDAVSLAGLLEGNEGLIKIFRGEPIQTTFDGAAGIGTHEDSDEVAGGNASEAEEERLDPVRRRANGSGRVASR